MSIWKDYVAYIKDNPEHHWFKRKLYGWGWVPAAWQGSLVVCLYVVAVLGFSFMVTDQSALSEVLLIFILPVVILTILLIIICYKKGEKPRWQWGQKNK